MTAKEEAKELLEKFQSISGHSRFSKMYALICVGDKIKLIMELPISDLMKYDLVEYEMRIQREIEKL